LVGVAVHDVVGHAEIVANLVSNNLWKAGTNIDWCLRSILNFAPRGEVVPQGWISPLGEKLSPEGKILCLPLHSSKQ
jgi:hypothetical protein